LIVLSPLQFAKAIVQTTLQPIPLETWQRLLPKDVVALGYHVVSDERLEHVRLYPYKNVAQFTSDVAFVCNRAVSYKQVVEHRLHNGHLAANSIMITFDDGFVECFDIVRPILLRFGVDAVFFVTTDFVDDRVPFAACATSLCVTAIDRMTPAQAKSAIAVSGLSSESLRRRSQNFRERASSRLRWSKAVANQSPEKRLLLTWVLGFAADDGAEIERACGFLGVDPYEYSIRRPVFMSSAQVRQLAADRFTIGAHGLAHRCLEGRSASEIEREIVESCMKIRELTGQSRVPFAFPYSGRRIDRNVLRNIMSRHSDLVDLIFDSGWLQRDPGFIVNRVFADEPSSGKETNLPRRLQSAWSIPSAWWLRNTPANASTPLPHKVYDPQGPQ
jgi:peptidoglycan/xylan/chitin deacetylase (PgdA/CDA1 family)